MADYFYCVEFEKHPLNIVKKVSGIHSTSTEDYSEILDDIRTMIKMEQISSYGYVSNVVVVAFNKL